jgi:hypothetical protein
MSTRWRELITAGDHAEIRQALLRIVSARDQDAEDLTHDLYLALHIKDRFSFYIESGMTDREIGEQISFIELRNLRNGRLRAQRPERYRLASRITRLLRTSSKLRRFAGGRYGLSSWNDEKTRCGELAGEIDVAVVPRDVRCVGRGATDQLIIGNDDLEKLIVRILTAANIPLDRAALRSLVFDRLTIADPEFLELEFQTSADDIVEFPAPSSCLDPEEELLKHEEAGQAQRAARSLLLDLDLKSRTILYHRYLVRRRQTQIEVAASLGVSNSQICMREKAVLERVRCAWSGSPEPFVEALRYQASILPA